MKPILGILGGMGVRASAEFTRTLYQHNVEGVEQDSPSLILFSDPTFPDRTESFLRGSYGPLVSLLEERLNLLYGLNVSKVVLGCVTLHYAVPMLAENLQGRILSLVDVALKAVAKSDRRHLLFCSTGSRASQVFENHERWAEAKSHIVWPDEKDQDLIHSLLYRYKTNSEEQPFVPHLDRLLTKYGVNSFVAGCSELHMLTTHLARENSELQFIDPLLLIAKNLPSFMQQGDSPSPHIPAVYPLNSELFHFQTDLQ